jgi:hypothetical protein
MRVLVVGIPDITDDDPFFSGIPSPADLIEEPRQ